MMNINGNREVINANRVVSLGGILVASGLMMGCITEEDLRQSSWYKGDEVQITVYEEQPQPAAAPVAPVTVSSYSAPAKVVAKPVSSSPAPMRSVAKPVEPKITSIPALVKPVPSPSGLVEAPAKVVTTGKAEVKVESSHGVAEVKMTEVKMTEVKKAEVLSPVTVAEVKVPEVPVAQVKVTEPKVEETKVAEVKVPEVKVPEVKVDSGVEDLMAKASSGDSVARFDLAYRYRTGLGVDQDLEKAFSLYSEGAALKHGPSLNNAAVMMLQGEGTGQDGVKAVELLKMAADQGVAQSQGNLVRVYYDGLGGVEKNFEEARMWYRRASQSIEVPQEIAYINP